MEFIVQFPLYSRQDRKISNQTSKYVEINWPGNSVSVGILLRFTWTNEQIVPENTAMKAK